MAYDHINLTFLEEFAKGDSKRMKRYINMFLQSAPGGIESMRTHYAGQDWEQLKSAAHSLKPQVGYMGIASLKEIIPRLEEYAREKKNLEQIPQLIDEVESICGNAFEELRQAVRSMAD